jgi:pyridoxine 5-phosphate synthase
MPHQPSAQPVCALSVNVNKVATLRNTRALAIPSVVRAAQVCLQAGAQGITVHPRSDQRHIKPQDVLDLAALLKQWPDREFNIEGNPFHNLMEHVAAVRPHQVTFVPDTQHQATSDHGWNLHLHSAMLKPRIDQAKALGVRVSLFMDPDPAAMALAKQVGADRVELYTEPYARAWGTSSQAQVLALYQQTAQAALNAGLQINAGHDLNQDNLTDFLRHVPAVSEVSIGHAFMADALEHGYAATVGFYLAAIAKAYALPKVVG